MHFRTVKCTGYLKKVNDGRFILNDNNVCQYVDLNSKDKPDEGFYRDECDMCWVKDIEEYCGSLEFLKTYYQIVKKEFTGMCVGYKDIIITSWLYMDAYDNYNGTEIDYVGKQAKDVIRCGVVYFADNRKRYVPLDNMVELDTETK